MCCGGPDPADMGWFMSAERLLVDGGGDRAVYEAGGRRRALVKCVLHISPNEDPCSGVGNGSMY